MRLKLRRALFYMRLRSPVFSPLFAVFSAGLSSLSAYAAPPAPITQPGVELVAEVMEVSRNCVWTDNIDRTPYTYECLILRVTAPDNYAGKKIVISFELNIYGSSAKLPSQMDIVGALCSFRIRQLELDAGKGMRQWEGFKSLCVKKSLLLHPQ